MTLSIYPIALGFDTAYLLKDRGVVLVDGGEPNKGKTLLAALAEAGVQAGEVQLIVITHGHWDHIGSAAEIKEITGAKVAMHGNEKHWLEQSLKPMPPGATPWGSVFGKLITWLMLPFIRIRPTSVDIVLEQDGFSLQEYGIAGEVVHTPGHSSGSVSVVLDSGEAFVGDLAMNRFPLRFSPGLPVFAEDTPTVIESWKKLLDRGVKTVYPAHGKPFPAEVMREVVARY